MSTKNKPKMRFGLKFLIGLVTVATCFLAYFAQPVAIVRKQDRIVAKIVEKGGEVTRGMPRWKQSLRWVVALQIGKFPPSEMTVKLRGAEVSGDDLRDILSLQYIQHLDLSDTNIGDESLKQLSSLKFIRSVNLDNTQVSDQGIVVFSNMKTLGSLSTMGTDVSYKALQGLDEKLPYANFAEERAFAELKDTGIQIADVPRYLNAPSPFDGRPDTLVAGHEIDHVVVGMNRQIHLTDKMVRDLGYLSSLTELRIHDATLGPKGLSSLNGFQSLKILEVYHSDVSDGDIEAIARLKAIEELELYGSEKLTGENLELLKKLPKLGRLMIRQCPQVPKAALENLKRVLRNCDCDF